MKLLYGIIVAILAVIVALLCKVLPTSPFLAYLGWSEFNEYLPYINYFIPIDSFITIGEAWLSCVGIWFLVKIARKAVATVSDISPLN